MATPAAQSTTAGIAWDGPLPKRAPPALCQASRDGCLPRTLPRPERLPEVAAAQTRKALLCKAFRCAEEDSNLHPVIPGPGPQPGRTPAHRLHSALNRDKPSAGLDDLDGSDGMDVLKSVLTDAPRPARTRSKRTAENRSHHDTVRWMPEELQTAFGAAARVGRALRRRTCGAWNLAPEEIVHNSERCPGREDADHVSTASSPSR
jgi:hypothetical protein